MIPIHEKQEISIYDSIDNMPLYNFDRYFATHDLNWFRVGFTGREKKATGAELKRLKDAEEVVMEQYFTALDDRSFQVKLQKWAKIDDLKAKYNRVSSVLQIMWGGFPNTDAGHEMRYKYIQYLKAERYIMPLINTELGDAEELVRINNDLQGIKTRIAILSGELQSDGKKESMGLYRQIAIAKSALPGYEMNPKVMVVAEWVEICKLLQEKAKQN